MLKAEPKRPSPKLEEGLAEDSQLLHIEAQISRMERDPRWHLVQVAQETESQGSQDISQSTSELMAELGLQDMSCEPQGNTVPGPPPAPLHPFLLEQSSTKGP